MEFEYTEDQKLLRDMIGQFGEESVRPIQMEMDEKESIPEGVLAQMAELGLLGLAVPESAGGSEVTRLTQIIVAEALGRASASLAVTVTYHAFLLPAILVACGSDEQRSRWLPEIAAGKTVGTALIEPASLANEESGSPSVGIRVGRTDQEWKLDGETDWVVNGQTAGLASLFARSAEGLKGFLLTPALDGAGVSPMARKLGLRPVDFAQWTFQASPVDSSAGLDAGESALRNLRHLADLFLAAVAVGLIQNCLDVSRDYAKERKQFGRPIGSFQLVQELIADMVFDVEAARLLVYRAAAETEGRALELENCRPWIARARSLASEAALKAGSETVQIHGGYGFSAEYPAERLFRDARALALMNGGTGDLLRASAEPVVGAALGDSKG